MIVPTSGSRGHTPTVEERRVALARASTGRKVDPAAATFFFLCALSILFLVLGIALMTVVQSWPSLSRFGLGFLFSQTWDPVAGRFGALPFIFGTLVTSIVALLVGGPVGLGAAIALSELTPGATRDALSSLVELLAAIPSVVYGLWGIFVLAPVLRLTVEPALRDTLGFLPFFAGPAYGVGLLAGGLILAIMIVPTIAAVSRDVLRAVPVDQREAMLALGATRWEMIQGAVIPYARTGIIGGIILGLGRALGETMAVTMVIGNRPAVSASLFAPGYTLASVIANEFTEAATDLHLAALVEIGLVLLGVTVVVNAIARLLVWQINRSVSINSGG